MSSDEIVDEGADFTGPGGQFVVGVVDEEEGFGFIAVGDGDVGELDAGLVGVVLGEGGEDAGDGFD